MSTVPLRSIAEPCPLCSDPGPHPGLLELHRRNPYNPRSVACHVKVVRCDRCRTLRLDPRPDDDSLDRLQSSALGDSETEIGSFEAGNTNVRYPAFVRQRLRRHGFPDDSGHLLDVGCGSGDLLADVCRQLDCQGTGLEVSEASLGRARRRFPGLRWVQGHVDEGLFPAASFDAILLVHVLEHIPAPLKALQALRKWLVPGGLLLVEVPNGEFYFSRTYGLLFESLKPALAAWHRARGRNPPFTCRAVYPYHVTLFGAETLAAMLRKADFEVVESGFSTSRVESWLEEARRTGQLARRVTNRLKLWLASRGLGDNLLLIARKV